MRYPSLKAGQHNLAVRAMQSGLHRALHAKGLPHGNLRNGAYGSKTEDDVNRFKRAYVTPKGPISGKAFGTDAWDALKPFLGNYDRGLVRRHKALVRAARAAAQAAKAEMEESQPRNRLAMTALEFYARRNLYRYNQHRPMPSDLFSFEAYTRLDCSSSVTLIYKEAGCEDPNGRGYDGQGYTGTLWPRGTYNLAGSRAGDLAFYGWQAGGIPSHVAVHINSLEVVSFGHTPIERYPLRYRSDYRGSRSYL